MRLALFVSSLDRIRHFDYRVDRRLYHGADLRRFASSRDYLRCVEDMCVL
jgi:hypothetical protein